MNLSSKESHPELSYELEQEKATWVSMAANQQKTARPMNVHNEASPSHAQHKKESINIPYRTRVMKWLFPPHFSTRLYRTLRLGFKKHQSDSQLPSQIHQEQTGKQRKG